MVSSSGGSILELLLTRTSEDVFASVHYIDTDRRHSGIHILLLHKARRASLVPATHWVAGSLCSRRVRMFGCPRFVPVYCSFATTFVGKGPLAQRPDRPLDYFVAQPPLQLRTFQQSDKPSDAIRIL